MNKPHKINTFTVEAAVPADIPGILAVLDENLLVNKDRSVIDRLEQSGFLIARHSIEDLLHWIEDKENHIVLVCKEAQEVVGYILGCDLKVLPSEMQGKFAEVELLRSILATHPVLYHKQIAIKPNRKGAGSRLLQGLFEAAANNGYDHVVCLIVHEPVLNKVSVEFHQKYGFEYLSVVQVDDMRDGVYLKKMGIR